MDLVATFSAGNTSTPLSSAPALFTYRFEVEMEDMAPDERLLDLGLGGAVNKDCGSISSRISSIMFNGRVERANFVLQMNKEPVSMTIGFKNKSNQHWADNEHPHSYIRQTHIVSGSIQ